MFPIPYTVPLILFSLNAIHVRLCHFWRYYIILYLYQFHRWPRTRGSHQRGRKSTAIPESSTERSSDAPKSAERARFVFQTLMRTFITLLNWIQGLFVGSSCLNEEYMFICQTHSVLRLLFIFARCVRFVGRIKDTAERCLVFVLVSRRASNWSNQCNHESENTPMDCTYCLLLVILVVNHITELFNCQLLL